MMSKQRVDPIRVYVMDGAIRPSHDSAPFGEVPMTGQEASTLRTQIARYMKKCRDRRERERQMSETYRARMGAKS